jgi:hypothetical protein
MICIIKRPHFSSRTVCEVLWLVTSIADYRFNNNGVQHLITYTSWNWTVVCEQLTKRIRSKNGLFKTSCALKLCSQKQWLNQQKTRPAWIKASWQFPVRWQSVSDFFLAGAISNCIARSSNWRRQRQQEITFSRVSCLSPRDIHIARAQNKQDHCIQHASKVGHVWTGDLLAATCQVVIPVRA